jgi:hypothetical protein
VAVVLGTNSGFVTVAPTADPNGTGVTIDGNKAVTKHTSPSNVVRITEIGWYRASGTNTANWEVGLYADSSGTAGARLFVDATNSTASNGWLTVAVDWAISDSTAYWLALQMDAHSGSSSVDGEITGGAGIDILAGTTLDDPFGGGAVSDADGMYAIYALVELDSVPHTVEPDDTLSLGDSASTAKTIPNAQADTLATPADAASLAWTQDRDQNEVVALADSLTRVHDAARTPADSVVLADLAATAKSIPLAVDDSVTLADEATPDNQAGGTPHTVEPDDSLALTDARTFAQGKAVTDSLALADQLARAVDYGRAQDDGLALADAQSSARELLQADLLALADNFTRVAEYARSVADSLALADQATPVKSGSGEQPIDDLLALSDSFSRLATYTRTVADSVALTDQATPTRDYGRTLADTLALADSLASLTGKGVTIDDTVTLTDSFFRLATYVRTPADGLDITDLLGTGIGRIVTVDDLLALADAQDIFNGVVTTMIDVIYTGRIADGFAGMIDGRENGGVADTVAGVVEEEVEV